MMSHGVSAQKKLYHVRIIVVPHYSYNHPHAHLPFMVEMAIYSEKRNNATESFLDSSSPSSQSCIYQSVPDQ